MVVNRLQKGLINSCIAPRNSMVNCQNIFFFVILTEIFILKTTISQVYTYITKIQNKQKIFPANLTLQRNAF
jgi:hypothetical protein